MTLLMLGAAIIVASVFGMFWLNGGQFGTVFHLNEFVLVVGTALGAFLVGNTSRVLGDLRAVVAAAVRRRRHGEAFEQQLLTLTYTLLQTSARDGVRALDEHLDDPGRSSIFQRSRHVLANAKLVDFTVDALRVATLSKGTRGELDSLLAMEIESRERRMMQPVRALNKLADSMPGFGIIAAVLGLVLAMYDIGAGEATAMVTRQVAVAMVGTFFGVFACYAVLSPLANRLSQSVTVEMTGYECVRAALIAFMSGKSPLLSADAGRRMLQYGALPSFGALEDWVRHAGDGR
ncbi:motility-associated protein [Pandoraea pulmonicola]|uniref:Chemotaxis protein MotA n=2 Tax=Pandoraea pulmonicola TaxID=93221 RepID=A0AAJ5CZS2_PANPU|nr:motility-associated protein [Pandoraea pulmonicola]SUA89903.1 Chemotaxis protein MotA [Pandoraea pulmonicola]